MKTMLLAMAIGCGAVAGYVVHGADAPLQSGIDRKNFDESVKPGQDFFEYVNGTWLKNNPIPGDYTRWGSFSELQDRDQKQMREILDGLMKSSDKFTEDQRKLRDFYATATDEAKLQKDGAAPLKGELDRIAGLASVDELPGLLGHLHAEGIASVFRFGVGIDDKNSTQYISELSQGGLSLPEKNYYVAADADSKAIREKYVAHVAKMLELLGDSPEQATKGAAAVMEVETKLAEASRTPVQLRDVEKRYNKKTMDEVRQLTPKFNWDAYLKAVGSPELKDLIVGEPEFFTRVNELLTSVPLEQWKTYLKWQLIDETSAYLSDDFVNCTFEFFGKTLRGQKQIEARWKRAVQSTDRAMGEDLGKIYVEKYFPAESKKRMTELVKNLIEAYRDRIKTRDWMNEQTKQQALAKLDKVMRKVGYPDKWRDYSALKIETDSYVQNVLRARAFNFNYRLNKLGKPIDKSEWGMTPPTVNAYYNPTMNEIVFPAGILQPPFFDPKADDAVNYGGIGAVIGHELTHGFDDQGSLYDSDGNLKNWWTPDDKSRFHAKAESLAKEYDACVALDDLHVNGHLTLGENLADLGGLTIAYNAYHRSLEGKPAPVIDGFTGDQRFFIGFGQIWRSANRPESLRVRLRTDPHSPEHFRCDVPVSNFPPFYEAFGIKSGDAMYRSAEDRVEVW
ncbi:MAG TPA: M13 family metallopeptidase [Tepidisphaeraceae bacterium]|jgi:putative endopeptidase